MSYTVYLRENLGGARNHHLVFVETEPDGAGYSFQVAGTIQQGMAFDHKPVKNEKDSEEICVGQKKIGIVTKANFDRIQSIVETLPPPPKQYQGNKRIDSSVALRRCQEWTADAIQLLKDEGIRASCAFCMCSIEFKS